jgi:integrase
VVLKNLVYDDKSWVIWMEDLDNLSDSLQSKYPTYVQRFLDFCDLTPDQLYELRLSSLNKEDRRDRLKVERMVKNWLNDLDEELSHGTVNNHYYALKNFFESQGLPFKLKATDRPRGDHIGQRMITKPMINRMIELVSYRMRERNLALLYILKDTGLRIGDLCDLTIMKYLEAKTHFSEDGEVFKEFKPLVTKKSMITAYPMIGPEAIEQIDIYLETRKDDLPWLFLGERGDQLKFYTLSKIFQRWSDKLKDGDRISAHSFRKFHQTQLEASGLNPNILKKLQGRTIADSTKSYSRPQDQPGLIAEQYINHYDAIRVKDNSELRELRKKQLNESARLETKINQLESDRFNSQDVIIQLSKQLERLSKKVENMERGK